MLKIENYIGGQLVEPVSQNYLDNYNPAVGEVYSLIPDSDERDVGKAVEAAKKAFPAWSKMSAESRHDVLMKIVALIERDSESLATAESIDNGKPKSLAKAVDIPRAVANFKFYATAAMHTATEAHDTVGQAINYTLRQPLGVGRLYFAVESAALLIHLENRARARRRLLRGGKAFGNYADDGIFVVETLY